ncbi:hypothetical protein LCGC14_1827810 [marine sediment metagenome]|uniref:Uncharacterized protein n=1 Tax=marine sediment metagenome TaxID=412755 RepID=A0A0F9H546_9ZZZZ
MMKILMEIFWQWCGATILIIAGMVVWLIGSGEMTPSTTWAWIVIFLWAITSVALGIRTILRPS